ncbi:UNVERIFIED_CONTAM: flagellar M-ring protein FliF, partial [Salmonella enterica subsp. enterica serovar Enteritidis]
SPFSAVYNTCCELPFWHQQFFIDELLAACRWLLVLVVAWILWRKAVVPQLTRRVEEAKAALEQALVRQETEEAVEVRLSK